MFTFPGTYNQKPGRRRVQSRGLRRREEFQKGELRVALSLSSYLRCMISIELIRTNLLNQNRSRAVLRTRSHLTLHHYLDVNLHAKRCFPQFLKNKTCVASVIPGAWP